MFEQFILHRGIEISVEALCAVRGGCLLSRAPFCAWLRPL